MRIASLLLVFAIAKAMALAGHDLPITWWAPIAYLWQDAVVVLVFAAIEASLLRNQQRPLVAQAFRPANGRRAALKGCATSDFATCSKPLWLLYAAVVSYVALNVPVTRVLSTPLTWPMWRAARGPLTDSIWQYATWENALLVSSVIAIALVAPTIFRSVARSPLVAGMVVLVALGPAASARVDTLGLDRNAWTALVTIAMPRVPTQPLDGEWHTTGFEHAADERLVPFRGAAAGRHVVLVSLESTAAQYLGLYGAQPDVMPNLSELGSRAIVFDHAYAVYPESIKGLYSILCSTYPALDSVAEAYATMPCSSIADVLARRGYRTALFHSGRFGYLGMDAMIRERGYHVLADAGDIGGEHDSSFGVDEPSTVARILKWVDDVSAGERFFVTYLPIAGHHPYETPEPGPFPEDDELGRYRNALHYADASLGTLMRGLRARGLEDTTLWIVLGDHGEAFGQHDGNYGHTFHVFEENVHVPMLIAAPGLLARQLRSGQVVSLLDTSPTILDLIGEPAPETYQGRSMLSDEPRMAFFLADYSLAWLGLRDGRFKYVYELGSGRAKLFDLDQDPHETSDLSSHHAERSERYRRDLRGWSAAQQQRLTTAGHLLKSMSQRMK